MAKMILLNLLCATILCVANAKKRYIVSRVEWNARPPKAIESMENPVPYVIIHNSYIPAACKTKEKCIEAMHWMQNFHQHNRSWDDIGFNFAVGSDGRAYEGRGWSRVGDHAPTYNDKSIGICLIGDWRVELPPLRQLEATKQLIQLGVNLSMISDDYILVTHCQVTEGAECPRDKLVDEITTWPHFSNKTLIKPKDPDTAVGTDTQAVGTDTQAVGTDTQAVGTDTQAVGTDTQAVGTDTQAVGTDTQAAGTDTQAVGIDTQAAGTDTQAAGTDTQAAGTDEELTDVIVMNFYEEYYYGYYL